MKHSRLAQNAVGADNLRAETPGLPLAGVTINRQGQLVGWFNRLGDGPPNVGHFDPGVYELYFPGLADLNGSVVHSATVSGETPGVLGDPGQATARMSGSCSGNCVDHPLVNTFDRSGQPADLGFSYVMFLGDSD